MTGTTYQAESGASWRQALALVFMAAFMVCGCTSPAEYVRNGFKVGPNYAKPPVPVGSKWIDTGDKRLDSQTPANVEWWTVLNDPVLNYLVKKAYQDNLTLRQAAYKVLQFQAQRAIAAGNLLPQTQQANGSYSRNAASREAANSAFIPTRFYSLWDNGFNLSWELDFWGRLRRIVESADASLDQSIEDYDAALVTLIGNVASTYVSVRTFQTRIKLANDNLILQQETFKIAHALFTAGKTTKIDEDQALTNLAQVEQLIPQLEINLRQSENQLCVLLGMPPQDLENILGTASIPTVAPDIVVGIPADLLRRRPDVLSAERQAAAQSAQIGVAQAQLYPIVSINGTISYQASRFVDLFTSQAIAGSIGPSFTWNVLNYGRLINGVRVQDALFQQLVANYQNKVLSAEAEVENGITSYLKSHQVVRYSAKGVAAGEDGVKLATVQYREGKIPFITLATLQQNLVTQQDTLATAYGNLVQGLIQTYQALGGGWQIRLGDKGATVEESAPPAPKKIPDVPATMPEARLQGSPQPLASLSAAEATPAEHVPAARIDVKNVR